MAALLTLSLLNLPLANDGWQRVAEHAAFSPRDTSEGVVFQGQMWLSNAYHNGNVLVRDLWRSADGATWTLVSDATPYDGYSEMVVYHDKIWAIKGSVWTSEDGEHWTQVAEETPFGVRGYGECVVFQGRIWHLGSGADVWSTTDGIDWKCHETIAPWGQRAASAVAVFQDKLWLLGGRTAGINTPPEQGYKTMISHHDVWSSPDGETWTRVTEHAPWSPRQWHIAQVYAGRLWILGGHDNVNSANLGDTWSTADGVTWEKLESASHWSPRHEVTPYVFDGSLWVVAGNAWPLMNDVWRLTVSPE